MRIGLTSIFVDDQDHAERFSTQVLGLQVKTSVPYGPTERWLSVGRPRGPRRGGAGAAPGDRAWWLPRWLGWLPRLTIEAPAAPAAPVPAAESGTEAGLPSR
jgi:hypothetical protein